MSLQPSTGWTNFKSQEFVKADTQNSKTAHVSCSLTRMVMLMTTLMTLLSWAKRFPWPPEWPPWFSMMLAGHPDIRWSPTWQSRTWHWVALKALVHHKPSSMWRQNAGWNDETCDGNRKPRIQESQRLDNLVVELQFPAKGLPTRSTSIWELYIYWYCCILYMYVWTCMN